MDVVKVVDVVESGAQVVGADVLAKVVVVVAVVSLTRKVVAVAVAAVHFVASSSSINNIRLDRLGLTLFISVDVGCMISITGAHNVT